MPQTILEALEVARLLILVALIVGCSPLVTYKLRDGSVVNCKWMLQKECGVDLAECSDSQEYFCQRDLQTFEGPVLPYADHRNSKGWF